MLYEFETWRGGQRQMVPAIIVRPASVRSKFVTIKYHPWKKIQVRCGAGKRHYVDTCLADEWRFRLLRSDEELARLKATTDQ